MRAEFARVLVPGATEAEALENIPSAICDYLEAEIEPEDGAETREIEVAV